MTQAGIASTMRNTKRDSSMLVIERQREGSEPQQWPVQPRAQGQRKEFEDRQKSSDLDEIGVAEIPIGVAYDQNRRLIREKLSARRERPHHAHPQRIEAVRL